MPDRPGPARPAPPSGAAWVVVALLYLAALPLVPGRLDARVVAASLVVLAAAAAITELVAARRR